MQKRTQDGGSGNTNMFEAYQYKAAVLWLNYTVNPGFKFALNPISYFDNSVLNVKPSDLLSAPVKEIRSAMRLSNEQHFKYLSYINNFTLEYRVRDLKNNDVYQPNFRLRYMLRFEKSLKLRFLENSLTFICFNESMIQFGKAVRGNANMFDQNRLYGGLSYPVLKNVKLNVGYIYGFQERASGKEFDHINTLWVVLTLDNLFSQFYNKK